MDVRDHKMAQIRPRFGVSQKLIRECDVFVFRSLHGGRMPAGVAKEIEFARDLGRPVLELPTEVLRRGISVDKTCEYLKEVGQR